MLCEPLPLSRRGLLGAGLSFFAWTHMPRRASAAGARDPRLLVVILRGALDGLSAVAPVGDPDYDALRTGIALAKEGPNAGVSIDGFFVLHPALPNLARLYKDGKAAIVHAVASPYRERSHFDGQDVLESGLPGVGKIDSGWLNRTLLALPKGERVNPRGGLGVGPVTPLILRGEAPVLGWAPQQVGGANDDLGRRMLDLYGRTDRRLGEALMAGIETDRLAKAKGAAGKPDPNVSMMIRAAEGAAKLIAADDGPRVAVLSFDGWDTHADQGGVKGRLATLLGGLDGAFAAFETGLQPVWADTAVLVITEFGRTAKINGTEGSDHGTATVAFALGGAISGGRLIADWPGLKPADLYEARDLKPTTDLRAVAKALLSDHLGLSEQVLANAIFPDSGAIRPMAGLVV